MDFQSLDKKLSENPAWRKVRRFSMLQDFFLCASLTFESIHVSFEPNHSWWAVAFLIAGLVSLIAGHMSKETFRKYFTQKGD